jgi:hypothetical protein
MAGKLGRQATTWKTKEVDARIILKWILKKQDGRA